MTRLPLIAAVLALSVVSANAAPVQSPSSAACFEVTRLEGPGGNLITIDQAIPCATVTPSEQSILRIIIQFLTGGDAQVAAGADAAAGSQPAGEVSSDTS